MKICEKKFWPGMIVFLATLALLFLFGCDDFPGPEARQASEVRVFNVGDRRIDRPMLDSEGRVTSAEGDQVAAFFYPSGDMVEVGGLRFHPTGPSVARYIQRENATGRPYSIATDRAEMRSNLTTNGNGYALFTGSCDLWGVEDLQTWIFVKGHNTPARGVGITFQNWWDVRTHWTKLTPWYDNYYSKDWQTWFVGGDVCSVKCYSCSSVPVNVAGNEAAAGFGGFSAGEDTFLAAAGNSPASGFTVSAVEWCIQTAEAGIKPVDNFCPLDECDPNIIKYYGSPYFASFHVALADSVGENFIGEIIPAQIWFGNRTKETINTVIFGLSDDRKSAIIRSDYFIPVIPQAYTLEKADLEVYDRWSFVENAKSPDIDIFAPLFFDKPYADPNYVSIDPNYVENGVILQRVNPARFRPVHIIPAADNEIVRIRLKLDKANFLPILQYWLSDNKVFDINDDGIVNLSDLPD
ncbi:MAG: hypothetical protein PHF37_03125 [Phycisphaerae bacterium]|jgi:hypothetical protein|nr:hypothetical protein [Phycisphaerae bacterium]